MNLNEYVNLVRNAKLPTDEVVLATTFAAIKEMAYAFHDDEDWMSYPGEEPEMYTKTAKEDRDLKAYVRGVCMTQIWAGLACNPVYVGMNKNGKLLTGLGQMPDSKEYLAIAYVFASKKAGETFFSNDENRVGAPPLEEIQFKRVPFAALCEHITSSYLLEKKKATNQMYSGKDPEYPRVPVYALYWIDEETGELCQIKISGHFMNKVIPTLVLGAVDHEAASVVRENGDDFIFDPGMCRPDKETLDFIYDGAEALRQQDAQREHQRPRRRGPGLRRSNPPPKS